MAAKNLTSSGATTVQSGYVKQARIQVNAALTGTIIVSDGSTTVATIANPTVGSYFEYWDFATSVVVNPSTSCDITVNTNSGFQPY